MIAEKKILVVSNEAELLGFLQHNLPEGGYKVTSVADTAADLKEIVNHFLPDLIILDILMPWLDGIEVCLRIRQWCQAPVIMLSTWDTDRDTIRSLDLSSNNYLTEPFGMTELMTHIEETLHRN